MKGTGARIQVVRVVGMPVEVGGIPHVQHNKLIRVGPHPLSSDGPDIVFKQELPDDCPPSQERRH